MISDKICQSCEKEFTIHPLGNYCAYCMKYGTIKPSEKIGRSDRIPYWERDLVTGGGEPMSDEFILEEFGPEVLKKFKQLKAQG